MKKRIKWLYVYWMPYDNNLSYLKDEIIGMLLKGSQSTEVTIYVFSDSTEQEFIQKTGIADGVIFENIDLKFKDSSDVQQLKTCLLELLNTYDTERLAFNILGHGGKIDEISPDENPGYVIEEKWSWMNIFRLKEAFIDITNRLGRKMDLLFLQNCCKGTIEANYNFKDIANIILSSQKVLGAPNYYYEDTFKYLSNYPNIDGEALARIIVETEADEMFYSYSIVNTNAFDEFAERLNRLIEALSFFELEYKSEEYVYEYEGEYLVDLGRFLRYISKGNQKTALLFLAFNQFYTSQLISYHKINPTKLKQNNSGLSLFYPRTIEEIPRYHYLDFYQEVKMSTIFEKIIKA